MVSICKRLINVEKLNKPKARVTGLSQKGQRSGNRDCKFPYHGRPTLPANRADLTGRVDHEERGKPDAPPSRGQANRKGCCWGSGQRRVKEANVAL